MKKLLIVACSFLIVLGYFGYCQAKDIPCPDGNGISHIGNGCGNTGNERVLISYPEIAKRVKDPLEINIIPAYIGNPADKTKMLSQIYAEHMVDIFGKEANDYELIEVSRPSHGDFLRFSVIKKDKLCPK
jgi:hypothetical protein